MLCDGRVSETLPDLVNRPTDYAVKLYFYHPSTSDHLALSTTNVKP